MLYPKDLDRAYKLWLLRYHGLEIDIDLIPFVGAKVRRDWIKKAREALMLSAETVAKNMNVSQSAYTRIEQHEENMSIKLATLAKVADAMGCELVYAIRPKFGQKFSNVVWDKLLPRARYRPIVQWQPHEKKPRAIAGEAVRLLESTRFRAEMGWVKKRQI